MLSITFAIHNTAAAVAACAIFTDADDVHNSNEMHFP